MKCLEVFYFPFFKT